MDRARELVEQLNQLVSSISVEYNNLNNDLSKLDLELGDIYHYIEFNNLNAADGYKIYKDLQFCLQRRRKVKENQSLLQTALNTNIKNSSTSINTKLDTIAKQDYVPRIRTDLFSKSILASKNGGTIPFNNLEDAIDYLISNKLTTLDSKMLKAKLKRIIVQSRSYAGYKWTFKKS